MRPAQHRGRLRRLERQVPADAEDQHEDLRLQLSEFHALAAAKDERAAQDVLRAVHRRHLSGDWRGITLERLHKLAEKA